MNEFKSGTVRGKMWQCDTCSEMSEDYVGTCWKCGTINNSPEREARVAELVRENDSIQERIASSPTIKELLSSYVGKQIGININDPGNIESASLVAVRDDYFVVNINHILHHIPLSQVIRITRASSGNVKSGVFSGSYSIIVKVFDLVVYKGAIGFGVSF